jgi:hypothetical protein
MNILRSMLAELLALFVDDRSLVLVVIAWVIGGVFCLRAQLLNPASAAVLLGAGISLLLAENVLRSARAHVAAPTREAD